jgi:hypothetical protein
MKNNYGFLAGGATLCAIGLISAIALRTESVAEAQAPSPIQWVASEKKVVAAARTQPCYADSCANRIQLSAVCPVGTHYIGTTATVRFFTNADSPTPRADVYDTGFKEVWYGNFSAPVAAANEVGQDVVTDYYLNRSTQNRLAAIVIPCQ